MVKSMGFNIAHGFNRGYRKDNIFITVLTVSFLVQNVTHKKHSPL